MSDESEIGAFPCVKDLAEGFSIQSKFSNKIWLSLLALIVVALSPSEASSVGRRKLPFSLGEIDGGVFDIVLFFTLCALTIAFCSSRAACLISYKIAHKKIDDLEKTRVNSKPTQRQYFDMLTSPGFIRVGPLGVLSKDIWNSSQTINRIQRIYYVAVRHLALILFLGLPFISIFISLFSLCGNEKIFGLVKVVAIVSGIIAIIPIVHIWVVETSITKVVKKVLHSNS